MIVVEDDVSIFNIDCEFEPCGIFKRYSHNLVSRSRVQCKILQILTRFRHPVDFDYAANVIQNAEKTMHLAKARI